MSSLSRMASEHPLQIWPWHCPWT